LPAPPSCGDQRPARVPRAAPRRWSLRLPLSLPGSFASLTMITRTDPRRAALTHPRQRSAHGLCTGGAQVAGHLGSTAEGGQDGCALIPPPAVLTAAGYPCEIEKRFQLDDAHAPTPPPARRAPPRARRHGAGGGAVGRAGGCRARLRAPRD